VKEMMFGTNESFKYMLCNECGLLQICNIPQDMGIYYPNNYGSLRENTNILRRIKDYAYKCSFKNFLFKQKNPLGLFREWMEPNLKFLTLFDELPHESILDVGCGTGYMLDTLSSLGFQNLQGIEMFISSDIITKNGVHIQKGSIHDITKPYELIMLHHSFEHMEDQLAVLKKIKSLLLPDGVCMIRIPVMNEAWNLYHENWYAIDAPRHFYLHTEKSFEILATQADFQIENVVYDSNEYSFIVSDLYQKGISFEELKKRLFSIYVKEIGIRKLLKYKKKAKLLNNTGMGDQAIFLIKGKN
jgi:2-polyprenyl-3-methyl-5-hydroxy-6-metoxy-1,4-benzoquinol methylase